MENLYEQYREVLTEKFGEDWEDEMELEEMEVIYERYLEFQEQKEMEHAQAQAQAQAHLEEPQEEYFNVTVVEGREQEYHQDLRQATQKEADNDETMRVEHGYYSLKDEDYEVDLLNYDSSVSVSVSSSSDESFIPEYDPLYLEREWKDFNEVGHSYVHGQNFTATTTSPTATTATMTTAIIAEDAAIPPRRAMVVITTSAWNNNNKSNNNKNGVVEQQQQQQKQEAKSSRRVIGSIWEEKIRFIHSYINNHPNCIIELDIIQIYTEKTKHFIYYSIPAQNNN